MKPTENKNLNHLNSNNSSNITFDNSNIYLKHKKNHFKSIYSNNQSNAYLNSSIFESRFSTNPNDYLTNTSNNIINNNNSSQISNINNNNNNNNNIYLTETKQIKTTSSKENLTKENLKSNNDSLITSSNTHRRIDNDPNKMEIFYPEFKGKTSIPPIHRLHPENHNIISCCDKKIKAKNLNNLFTNYYLIPPKIANKFTINYKKENIHVRDSSYDYIEKTKSIILLNYRLKLKKEAKKTIENNIKNQIKELDFKMEEIKKAKNELEDNFIIKYYTHLKQLQIGLDNERITNINLMLKLSSLNKEVNSLEGIIQKKKSYINNIEKWLKFLILLKTKKNFSDVKKALKENLNENGKIFNDVDEFEDIFVNEENKNIFLLKRYEQKRLEVENLKDERDLYEKNENKIASTLNNEILEKEKLHTLMRLRYESLRKLKGKILSNTNNNQFQSKKKPSSIKNLPQTNNKKLYLKIVQIYVNIYNNCFKEDIFIYNLKQIVNRNEKMIKMMICIELMCNYLIGKFNEYKNEKKFSKILIEIQSKIDFEHKRQKTIEKKQEEYKKYLELKKQIDKRNEKVYFIPKKKVDNYPFNIYVKPKNNKNNEKNVNKELTIEDFLYDLEED